MNVKTLSKIAALFITVLGTVNFLLFINFPTYTHITLRNHYITISNDFPLIWIWHFADCCFEPLPGRPTPHQLRAQNFPLHRHSVLYSILHWKGRKLHSKFWINYLWDPLTLAPHREVGPPTVCCQSVCIWVYDPSPLWRSVRVRHSPPPTRASNYYQL